MSLKKQPLNKINFTHILVSYYRYMLQIKNICKDFQGKHILKDVSFDVHASEKIALIGANGSGKSTLLKIIAGKISSDSGFVKIHNEKSIGYLPQEIVIDTGLSVEDYIKKEIGLIDVELRLGELERNLSTQKMIDEYEWLTEKHTSLKGYNFEYRLDTLLDGFGIKELKNNLVTHLSGGQKTKIALITLLLSNPDILLLDEPTNNLDIASIIWLEQYLENSNAAVIIVSHDRYFLDRVTRTLYEIDWFERTVTKRNETYSEYILRKEKELIALKEQKRIQDKEIAHLTSTADSYTKWGEKGRQLVSKDNDKMLLGAQRDNASKNAQKANKLRKRIEKIDKIELPKERKQLEIRFVPPEQRQLFTVHAHDITFSYGDHFSLGPLSLEIPYSDRVGIIGENGSGKTTFLKIITKELRPQTGEVSMSSSLKIGNLTQEHENLNEEKTLIKLLIEKTKINEATAFRVLTDFAFTPDLARRKIKTLSPGERARLLLAVFSEQGVNILILDEPTNHLDIEAIGALIDSLQSYTGTIIAVTHDRYFLEAIGTAHMYRFDNGNVHQIADYNEYVEELSQKARRLITKLQ